MRLKSDLVSTRPGLRMEHCTDGAPATLKPDILRTPHRFKSTPVKQSPRSSHSLFVDETMCNFAPRPPGPSRHAFEAVFAPPPLPITSSPRDASRSASSPPNASVPSMRLRLPIRLHHRSLVEFMCLRNVDSCKGRLPPRSRQPQCVCEQRRLEPQDFERGRPGR